MVAVGNRSRERSCVIQCILKLYSFTWLMRTLNSWSTCFHLPSAGITSVCHHCQFMHAKQFPINWTVSPTPGIQFSSLWLRFWTYSLLVTGAWQLKHLSLWITYLLGILSACEYPPAPCQFQPLLDAQFLGSLIGASAHTLVYHSFSWQEQLAQGVFPMATA